MDEMENSDEQLQSPVKPKYESVKSTIEAKDGQKFEVTFFQFPEGVKGAPMDSEIHTLTSEIERIAHGSFPHWTEQGRQSFVEKTLPNAKTLSVIRSENGDVVGFNIYTLADVEGMKLLYSNYGSVDPALDENGRPKFRGKGLFERTREVDLRVVDPDIASGCSAVGEIHLGVQALSDRTGRVVYPTEPSVPEEIGTLGRKVYSTVNGAESFNSVNARTMVRHGSTPYAKGKAHFPLFDHLNMGPNDGLIYLSIKKSILPKILTKA